LINSGRLHIWLSERAEDRIKACLNRQYRRRV